MKKLMIVLLILPVFTFAVMLPDGFKAMDKPDDNGRAFMLVWKKMAYEAFDVFYVPYLSTHPEGPFYEQDAISSELNFKSDFPAIFGYDSENCDWHAMEITKMKYVNENGEQIVDLIEAGRTYYVKLGVKKGFEAPVAMHPEVLQITPEGNFFAWNKLNNLLFFIFFMVAILSFIQWAKRNPNLFVRRIAGLEAMDDALGRATEMGKPVLFVHGLKFVHEVSTIAAINILGRIAKKVAEFDTPLKVANWDPVIQQVSRETVKESYIEAGRPDAYKEENIYFASSEQFSYAAAVEGLMVREKPAANFYFGYFYAESLLLSETGNATGAIQIAGTDAFTQIPFFITTCDYTLIGEELYAASAYLSREPRMLGSLKGQDLGKLIIIIVLIVGTILASLGYMGFARLFWSI